jgi:hypothetical protein
MLVILDITGRSGPVCCFVVYELIFFFLGGCDCVDKDAALVSQRAGDVKTELQELQELLACHHSRSFSALQWAPAQSRNQKVAAQIRVFGQQLRIPVGERKLISAVSSTK